MDDPELTDALGSLIAQAGFDPGDISRDLLEIMRRLLLIQSDVWLGITEAHLGWTFTDIWANADHDGAQMAFANR